MGWRDKNKMISVGGASTYLVGAWSSVPFVTSQRARWLSGHGQYSEDWHCLSPESTQVEDPRAQWQREQESMLRDYLSVARDALSAQKEIYQVKEQRLLLAQQEYRQLNDAWRDKSTSQTSREFHALFLP